MISNSKAKYFNLKDFELSNENQRSFLVKNLDNICKDTGFLLITGHGINKQIIDNIWSVIDIFFDQPTDLKERVKPPYKGYPYGYLGHGIEALAYSKGNKTPPDLKESFNAGPLSIPKSVNQKEALEFCYAPSLWPEISNFKNYWIEYYNSMKNLASRIMRALALALNLDENYFNPYINEPISALRALNYPYSYGGTYLAMEGPQFSTKAESNMYRQLSCDVIGMTNMPEAKLSKEAEIRYCSISMVTDYDCWHQEHESVNLEMVINTMKENTLKSKKFIKSISNDYYKSIDFSQDNTQSILDTSIVTNRKSWDPEIEKKLSTILKRFKKVNN